MSIHFPTSLRRIVVIAAAIICAGTCLMPNVSAQQAGYVLEINGQWILKGHGPLTKGQGVPTGGVVSAQSAAADDRIVIVNGNGDIVARRDCRNSGECARPIKLPQPASESSTWNVIVSSVMSLLGGEPDRYSVHRKRDEELPDGVVKISGAQLDVSPVFQKKSKGTYYFRLRTIPRPGDQPSKWAGPFTLNWDRARIATVAVSDARPGLYELALLDREGDDYLPTGASAWIVLTTPERFTETALTYQEAVELTRKWGTDVSPEGARSFLRARLDQLAKTTQE
jgi:hypothetical protein